MMRPLDETDVVCAKKATLEGTGADVVDVTVRVVLNAVTPFAETQSNVVSKYM